MRVLKYKAYHKFWNKIMDVISITCIDDQNYVYVKGLSNPLKVGIHVELMEYTNYFDKKEIDIYTGHLVKLEYNKGLYSITFNLHTGMYSLVPRGIEIADPNDLAIALYSVPSEEIEIIGDIYERHNKQTVS